ncbi:hypothetical protein E2C01_079385 [Portunus trituberculatus]|uniref:Uncharacterized protein n=1 Tax=Portunus trituberculatus TaxID=210409 RepID=A0A5B7IJF7_PORTR|nr:hypothetical protein [Portunus trituberculatus]
MRFPAEQSLHHIDDVLEEMRLRATATDSEIRDVVRSLASADQVCVGVFGCVLSVFYCVLSEFWCILVYFGVF